jgi:NAD-dependent dihydropyrimidine dehydrogenase PreA subunit
VITNIDAGKCIGCKTCVEVCMKDVLRWSEDNKKPFVAYSDDCQTCFNCEINCPGAAIYVHSRHKERIPPW